MFAQLPEFHGKTLLIWTQGLLGLALLSHFAKRTALVNAWIQRVSRAGWFVPRRVFGKFSPACAMYRKAKTSFTPGTEPLVTSFKTV